MTREDLIKIVKWSAPPRDLGGQHTNGPIDPTVILECETYHFKLTIGCHRSQLRNKELALTLLELAISELPK